MNTPNLPQRKLSEDPIFANLMAGDRVVVLRSALDEPDASKRNGTAGLEALRAALGLSFDAFLVLAEARALIQHNAVVPGRPYLINFGPATPGGAYGRLVMLSGGEDNATFRHFGEMSLNGVHSLVEADVLAGTVLPVQLGGAPTNFHDVTLTGTTTVQGEANKLPLKVIDVGGNELDVDGQTIRASSNFYFNTLGGNLLFQVGGVNIFQLTADSIYPFRQLVGAKFTQGLVLQPGLVAGLNPNLLESDGDGVFFTNVTARQRLAYQSEVLAQKLRLDNLLAGANADVDTFLEAYNRFLLDESAAAALQAQYNALVAQLNALSARVDTKGDLVTQQQHTQQLTALNTTVTGLANSVANIYVRDANGSRAYNTLNAALAAAPGAYMRFNTAVLPLTASTGGKWPQFLDGSGATITLVDGITLSIKASGFAACFSQNVFVLGPSATVGQPSTGIVKFIGTPDPGVTAATASLYVNWYCDQEAQNTGDVITLNGGYWRKLTGTGTFYLYGNVEVGSYASTLTIIDRRPGSTTSGGSGGGTTTPAAVPVDFEYLTPNAGAQSIALSNATFINLLGIRGGDGSLNPIAKSKYSLANGVLSILASANVLAAQTLEIKYQTAGSGQAGGTGGTTYTPGAGIAISSANAISVDPAGVNTRKVSTPAIDLVLEQTGDQYGRSRLTLQSRQGSAGAVFTTDLPLVDFAFAVSQNGTPYQLNLRYEARPTETQGTKNLTGEFQLINPYPNGLNGASATDFYTVFGKDQALFLNGQRIGVGVLEPLHSIHTRGKIMLNDSAEPDTPPGGCVLWSQAGKLYAKGADGLAHPLW